MVLRPPLFVVCPGRSFSSVICASIGQHPEAFGLPEVNLFVKPTVGGLIDAAVPFLGLQQATSGLRRSLAELLHGEQTDETIAEVDKWLRERRSWSGGRMFEEIRDLAAPRMIVEKSPSNVAGSGPDRARFRRLFDAFPDAMFLHVTRHPRSTSRSRQKVREKRSGLHEAIGVDPMADDEANWAQTHEYLLNLGYELPTSQYMLLNGEWFFEEPRLVLRQICQWLEISDDEDAITEMMHPENSPFAGPGPKSSPGGNNPGFLKNPKLRIGRIPAENLDDPFDGDSEEKLYFSPRSRALARLMGY